MSDIVVSDTLIYVYILIQKASIDRQMKREDIPYIEFWTILLTVYIYILNIQLQDL